MTSHPTLFHVDVFATGSLTGNGLTVFLNTEHWPASAMQRLTQESRQFESIFLSAVSPAGAVARIFTVEEELPFAGHPVLGAAAVLHRAQAPSAASCSWVLSLPHGNVAVTTIKLGTHYSCEMNQGQPILGARIPDAALTPILTRLGLDDTDVVSDAQVISTGLPYLIVPVSPAALARAKISGSDFEARLATLGAKFVLVLAVEGREMRTWDNLGLVEDVATGSAAGPAAAYLSARGLADPKLPIVLAQGRFTGRPSQITVVQDEDRNLLVRGEVWPVSHGTLDVDPLTLDGHWAV
ncbi:MAG TPA: PhzF family phenazine biosynthesis protein [Thermoanaerobaculia bacterium]|nr:PhzF family phenazine biosynthesis protein [Thermoanaerobaculia bacterium]